ncbi:hypothetical protein O181_040760 [Austropuccinia psidii MF-1]|uniref:AAA+ ATPase domain-containing protein n=1 Tax=Austropuccinia psidii MF-1 TaxID=1389203 RepID=A0A9Q3DDR0_9BASI|nr:hypothetical protein [Austropuccinia psidii MF-1]
MSIENLNLAADHQFSTELHQHQLRLKSNPIQPLQQPPSSIESNSRPRLHPSSSISPKVCSRSCPSSTTIVLRLNHSRNLEPQQSNSIHSNTSDRGRPIRNRRPPHSVVSQAQSSDSHLRKKPSVKNDQLNDLHPQLRFDSMARTRSAKSLLGTVDSNPILSSTSYRHSSNHFNNLSSDYGDKDADGEDEVEEDHDHDVDHHQNLIHHQGRFDQQAHHQEQDQQEDDDNDNDNDHDVEDDDDDGNFSPSKTDHDSDYRGPTDDDQVQQSEEEERISLRPMTRRQRAVRVESDDDDNFEPTMSNKSRHRRKHSESNESEHADRPQSDDDDYRAPSNLKQAQTQRLRNLARDRATTIPQSTNTNGIRRSARHAHSHSQSNKINQSDSNLHQKSHEEDEGRQLRNRKHVDYHIPPLHAFESAEKNKIDKANSDRAKKRLPMNMTGKQLDRLFGQKTGLDSDEEQTPAFDKVNPASILGPTTPGLFGTGLLDPTGLTAVGPSNLGKMSGTNNLADIDPLGVQTNIDFSYVGGMDHHIQQLKEMVSLPLLYPEVFQRFQITPPRGVLFHGPPGTGKTLLARALAASCSTNGQKISFFMRKGADCLSKWIGEAERQLRLLFDEAKNCQPSIIFFDEIDGLAPVRSSKQEQIHASIVSTLLSLMDGMDGRGQVVIIGATNRPDAVDPALRRPGRFDREFYFPLPNREARLSVLNIHTRGWDPPLSESFKFQLADLTKGYGGADLRALCTEAALNAVQRKYPQIYKTNKRLVIEPKEIDIIARDFTLAQKRLIPSTSRSTSNLANPLPSHIRPLLGEAFERAQELLAKVLPNSKQPSVLEEAEYEEDETDGFEREKLIQSFETMRVFRPRLVVCGPKGSGQQYIGNAILHHLEGYHIQSLDLTNLFSDSTLSAEARCIQIFAEAKRHKPSVLYIPSLHHWTSSTLEHLKGTVTNLLEDLKSSDPILLLAIVDCPFKELPRETRSWFGISKSNRILLEKPDLAKRVEFFDDIFTNIRLSPSNFPDAVPRKKKVLDILPEAPPLEPRRPTESELLSQLAQDKKMVEYLKFRLGPVLHELKKKHKRFIKPIGVSEFLGDPVVSQEVSARNGYYNVDLDNMHYKLYYNKYFTPQQFVADVEKIVFNAELDSQQSHAADHELRIKAQAMLTHTRIMVEQACDQQFDIDCQRMYERMKLRDPKLAPEKKNESENSKHMPTRRSSRINGTELKHKRTISNRGGRPSDSDRPSKRSKRREVSSCESGVEEVADHNPTIVEPIDPTPPVEQPPVPIEMPISTTPESESEVQIKGEDAQDISMGPSSQNHLPPPSLSNILNVEDCLPQNIEGTRLDSSTVPSNLTIRIAESEPSRHSPSIDNPPLTSFSDPLLPINNNSPSILNCSSSPIFDCRNDLIDGLSHKLIQETEGLVVSELEELRSGCFEIIWKCKSDWDRTQMIQKLIHWVNEFLAELKELKDDQNDQEGD